MRAVALGLIVALGLGSAAAGQTFRCSGAEVSPYPSLVPTGHDHMRMAPEGTGLGKLFTAYGALFDDGDDDDGDGQPDLRLNPEYVVYELRGVTPDAAGAYPEPPVSIARPSKWYRAPEFLPLIQSVAGVSSRRLDDSYSGVGTVWNRGHLAMSDHAQRISAEAACNTHHFWNASPQAADLNQGPWQHLENYSAAAANKYRSLWVATGPIFDPQTPRLAIGDPGEARVEIPDGFFKVLIHESPAGIHTLAFIYDQPNALDGQGRPQPTGTWVPCNQARGLGHVYDHAPQLVSIAQIELRTGLRFFAGRPDREALTASAAAALWPVETRYWDTGAVCAGQRNHP